MPDINIKKTFHPEGKRLDLSKVIDKQKYKNRTKMSLNLPLQIKGFGWRADTFHSDRKQYLLPPFMAFLEPVPEQAQAVPSPNGRKTTEPEQKV